MFKLFGSIGRFFRAILYTLAGDVSKWSEVWEKSTGYIHSEYDDIEKEQKSSINDLTEAVAGLLDLKKEKENQLESYTNKIEDKERKQAGAIHKAESIKKDLLSQGKSVEEIKTNPELQKALDWYNSFAQDLEQLREDAEFAENEISKFENNLAKYETKLQQAHRELKKIRSERHETIADIQLAKQEEKINATMLGISESKTGERRQRIQTLRRKQRNVADVNSRMSGLATQDAEDEFLQFANQREASSDFFDQIGLESESQESTSESPIQIPVE